MEKKQLIRLTNILKHSSRIVLLILSVGVFVFALVSGSESMGGGVKGVLKNIPNTFPWALLILAVLSSYKWPKLGSLFSLFFSLVLMYFLNFSGGNFFLSTFVLCLLLVFLSFTLVLTTWSSDQPKDPESD